LRLRHHPWRLALVLLYTAALFVVGSLPSTGGAASLNDKVLHLLVFGLQTWVAFPLALVWFPQPWHRSIWVAGAYSCATGAALEVVQAPLPHRTAEWLDLVADCVGAVLFASVLVVWQLARRRTPTRVSS
jgi:VanZ family protein